DMLVREGAKMSKSKGNIIPLNNVREKYGADLYRLYVTSSADLDHVIDWREKDVSSVQRKLDKFIEILEACEAADERKPETSIDHWMVSRFNRSLKLATQQMNGFHFREALVEIFFKLMNDVRWFERRSENPYGIVKTFAKDWLIAMAPVISHTAEEYWERLGGEGFISVAKWPKINESLIDGEAEGHEAFIQGVMEDIRGMIKMAEKTPKTIYLYTSPEWKWDALELVVNNKEKAMKKAGTFKNPKEAVKVLSSFLKNRVWDSPKERLDETTLLKGAEKILKSEFNSEIKVNNKHDPLKKAGKAMPFRPAVYLE
ncbi:MAG: class I tRNA ligase family protein, partial [Candidatus Altiarchaeota archaeon]|nr:class I tRNA ligase family protein [Candidatus Altiarchaeota archaeon]